MEDIEDTVKTPRIIIDDSLEVYSGKVLFPEKLEKANEILSRTKLPILCRYNTEDCRFIGSMTCSKCDNSSSYEKTYLDRS